MYLNSLIIKYTLTFSIFLIKNIKTDSQIIQIVKLIKLISQEFSK